MKRLIPLLLCLLLLWGCGSKEDTSKAFTYQKAPELFQLDLSQYDPSTGKIRFRIDDEGYLMSYTYELDGREILVTYSYQGRTITIFAFADDERIDVQLFTAAGDFDPTIPMQEYKGYYIRGYQMPE